MEFPPRRYHPTETKNLFIYKDKPADETKVPSESYALFWGEETLADKIKKSEYQKLGDAVAYFYGKKANIDEVCQDKTLGWDPK